MRRLATFTLAAILFAQPLSLSIAEEKVAYFPDLVFDKDKEGNNFWAEAYGNHLRVMNEPSLWKLSKSDPTATVFRLLWSPSFHPSVSVRIVETERSIMVYVVQLDGIIDTEPGKVAVRKTKTLTRAQMDEVKRLVAAAKFWTMPTTKAPDGGGIDVDGDAMIVEGVEGGTYHIVNRNTVDEFDPYVKLCRYLLLDVSGLDVRKTWNEYHE